MAVRWGTNLPGPFFVSWGKPARERDRGSWMPLLELSWLIVIWLVIGVFYMLWIMLVLMWQLLVLVVEAVREYQAAKAKARASEPEESDWAEAFEVPLIREPRHRKERVARG